MKYKIWNKQDPIVTPANEYFTAEEYIKQFAPAAKVGSLKFVVADQAINGAFFNEFEGMKTAYQNAGAVFADDMTDQEILDAISEFEANPPQAVPSPEERMAAAMEFQNLMLM